MWEQTPSGGGGRVEGNPEEALGALEEEEKVWRSPSCTDELAGRALLGQTSV